MHQRGHMRHAVRWGTGALIVQIAALAERLEPHVRVEVPEHVRGLACQHLLQFLPRQPTASDGIHSPAGCTHGTSTLFLCHRWLSGVAVEVICTWASAGVIGGSSAPAGSPGELFTAAALG